MAFDAPTAVATPVKCISGSTATGPPTYSGGVLLPSVIMADSRRDLRCLPL